jgi:hypothetical protein
VVAHASRGGEHDHEAQGTATPASRDCRREDGVGGARAEALDEVPATAWASSGVGERGAEDRQAAARRRPDDGSGRDPNAARPATARAHQPSPCPQWAAETARKATTAAPGEAAHSASPTSTPAA